MKYRRMGNSGLKLSQVSVGSWMTAHVYAKADVLAPREWIRDITGRELTPEDFLNYLEEKYGELYEL